MSIQFDFKKSNLIKGVTIITPSISSDERGNIWTSYLEDEIVVLLPKGLNFKHDKFSFSKKNVLRGIHGDSKSWKLVTCVFGMIQQVVVDLRVDSPTYLQWESFDIDSNNPRLILIPPSMGNAYYVYSKEAVYHYKLAYEGSYIDAVDQISIPWNNKKIGIQWRVEHPILSTRDDKS